MKYAGPRYVPVNTTNNCQLDVQEYWITDKQVTGHPCMKENQQLEPIANTYHKTVCHRNVTAYSRNIQIKHFNGYYKVYCFGHNITIDGQLMQCPDYIFEMPISQKFELDGQLYDLGEVSTVTINAVDLHINNDITDRLNMDTVKIIGTNLTGLDNAFGRLSRLTDSIFHNVTLIDSPFSDWFSGGIWGIFDFIGSIIEKFSMIISIVLFIGALIIMFPLIEIGMIIAKIVYSCFLGILSSYQNLATRWRRSRTRNVSRARLRRYLTRGV